MKIEATIVKAFTKDKSQGNPAGVIFNADNLTAEQMQSISSKINFSECVFIQKSEKADFRTRFFSPKQEVDFCGHATIAAFACIASKKDFGNNQKITLSQETNIGVFQIHCFKNGFIQMELAEPKTIDYKIDNSEIAKLLNINPESIVGIPQIVSTGSPKLVIQIKSLDVLFSIKPNLEGIKNFCIKSKSKGFYLFTNQTITKDADFHARQFNPLAGIDEDPITGIAGGSLAIYAIKNKILNKNKFIIEQGYIMNKFGKIYVEVNDKVKVGGYAVEFGKEIISIVGAK